MKSMLFYPFSLWLNLLQGGFFAILLIGNPVEAKRIATLDWTVAETLIALGEPPIAVGDKQSYQVWVAEPTLPDDVIDLGIRLQPNPEQIWRLKQQFPTEVHFINSGFYQSTYAMLSPFTKVDSVNFYQQGDAWQNMLNATKQIATLIGKPERYTQLVDHYSQKMVEIAPLVSPFRDRPIALVQFSDSRHLRIYAENSLFGAVLKQLGFQNAWVGSHNDWGFEWISVTQLATLPKNSRLVVIKPYPAHLGLELKHNTLWQQLPLAQSPLILPAVWMVGGLPSAQRFAEVFAEALQRGGAEW